MSYPWYLYIFWVVFLCTPPPAWGDNPLKPLEKTERAQKARIAIQVVDLSNGKVVYSKRANEEMIPASTVKLITTASAYKILGRDYRFATAIGYRGRLDDGTLDGDLIVRGSGDPSIASHYLPTDSARFLSELLSCVRGAGIDHIKGRIIVDASAQAAQGVNPSWLSEDLGNYYAAPSYAFNWNDNRIDLILSATAPADSVRILYSRMPHPEIEWLNNLRARRGMDTASAYGRPLSLRRVLSGFVPAYTGEYLLRTDMPDPALYAAMVIRDRLIASGIQVDAQAQACYVAAESPRFTTSVGLYFSPPLSALAREVNFRSINPWAESILLALSPAAIADRLSALVAIKEYWQSHYAIPSSSLLLDDGSGLSTRNRLSVSTLARILAAMAVFEGSDMRENPFLLSLPRAGYEGSVRQIRLSSEAEAYLKSGSMSGVRAYAGYLLTSSGSYAVAFIANDVKNAVAIRSAFQQTLNLIALTNESK